MADLIIKPATGDGNKLILQDKAGGAVLTTADSGATISGATIINTTGAITTTGTVTQSSIKLTPITEPGSPVEGQMYYDSNSNTIKIRNASGWETLSQGLNKFSSSSGVVSNHSSGGTDYVVHTFLTSGYFIPRQAISATYLIVAGGGSGGSAGGGGAGGYLTGTYTFRANEEYIVTVGAGGGSVTGGNAQGNDGANSLITGYDGYSIGPAIGGGGGGGYSSNTSGRTGGSGGGAGYPTSSAGAGTGGQGNAGGTSS